jgi:imidazole glycerol-phosphate synthase subunit HisH
VITIVDYGLGNVQAFLNVYKRLNVPASRATTVDELRGASKVILPGVGAFDHAIERLEASGMRKALDEMVLEGNVPVLGVCVGMQILARSSEEGSLPGLGWVNGRVRKFGSGAGTALPLPHMGWNDVQPAANHPLFRDLERDAKFYFLHSFYFECERGEDVAASSNYGLAFSSAVSAGNIHGVQFHPEKSHHFGIRLLHNFATLQDS